MRTIPAATFTEQRLAILETVDPEGIVITKRGRPVARLLPYRTDQADLIGSLAGKLTIDGDLFSTGLHWDAEGLHWDTESRHAHRPSRARRQPHTA